MVQLSIRLRGHCGGQVQMGVRTTIREANTLVISALLAGPVGARVTHRRGDTTAVRAARVREGVRVSVPARLGGGSNPGTPLRVSHVARYHG